MTLIVSIVPIMSTNNRRQPCVLALEDGTVFTGSRFGAGGTQTGEVVFNTSMTGYQEILTDPSYCGQIVTMTYPHMGNYGINTEDIESSRPWIGGLVVKEVTSRPSSYRATTSLDAYLSEAGVMGIQGIDTRSLTKKLRIDGAMRAVLSTEIDDLTEAVRLAANAPGMVGVDLVKRVAPTDSFTWNEGLDDRFIPRRAETASTMGQPEAQRAPSVVAIDCGMKRNILRHLVDTGCEVRVMPPTSSPEAVLESKPDGVFVSNGPGDPEAVSYGIALMRGLMGKVPIFGICLGHQLLGLALGAKSFKLKFGHRGANHPVLNVVTGKVEITSQNHGFAIDRVSLEKAGGQTTHINLNDQTLEGFLHHDKVVLAVQYHPEASPGPHDAAYLFDCFALMMTTGKIASASDMLDAQFNLSSRRGCQPSSQA